MPANRNVKGGKGYKKGKKSGGVERQSDFDSRGDGQDYGRVVRILGGRRVALFCNDGVERICKIRGAMCRGPKKQIIGVGDVVLFSMRTFDDGSDSDSDGGVVGVRGSSGCGDIILKYEANQWRQLRKEDGVNPSLFVADVSTTSASTGVNRGTVDIFSSEKKEGEGDGEDEEAGGGGGSSIAHVTANYTPTGADEELDIDLI
jgi:translation initiation factor 1A